MDNQTYQVLAELIVSMIEAGGDDEEDALLILAALEVDKAERRRRVALVALLGVFYLSQASPRRYYLRYAYVDRARPVPGGPLILQF